MYIIVQGVFQVWPLTGEFTRESECRHDFIGSTNFSEGIVVFLVSGRIDR